MYIEKEQYYDVYLNLIAKLLRPFLRNTGMAKGFGSLTNCTMRNLKRGLSAQGSFCIFWRSAHALARLILETFYE